MSQVSRIINSEPASQEGTTKQHLKVSRLFFIRQVKVVAVSFSVPLGLHFPSPGASCPNQEHSAGLRNKYSLKYLSWPSSHHSKSIVSQRDLKMASQLPARTRSPREGWRDEYSLVVRCRISAISFSRNLNLMTTIDCNLKSVLFKRNFTMNLTIFLPHIPQHKQQKADGFSTRSRPCSIEIRINLVVKKVSNFHKIFNEIIQN